MCLEKIARESRWGIAIRSTSSLLEHRPVPGTQPLLNRLTMHSGLRSRFLTSTGIRSVEILLEPSVRRSHRAACQTTAITQPTASTTGLKLAPAGNSTLHMTNSGHALQSSGIHTSARSEKRYTTGKPQRQVQWKKHRSKKAKRRRRKELQEYREANPAPRPAL